MTLTTKPVNNAPNRAEIRQLYHCAFPKEERLPWWLLRLNATRQGIDITGWLEEGGKLYYMGGNGARVDGWLWLEADRYYLQDGKLMFSTQEGNYEPCAYPLTDKGLSVEVARNKELYDQLKLELPLLLTKAQ